MVGVARPQAKGIFASWLSSSRGGSCKPMRSDTSYNGVIHDSSSSARLRRTRRRTTSDDQVSESTIAAAMTAHRPSAIDQRLAPRSADITPCADMVGEAGSVVTMPVAGAAAGALSTTVCPEPAPEPDGASTMSGTPARGAATDCVGSGGRISRRSGAHAVSTGISTSATSVTSQTRCRAPADARCMASVMPSAATRMSVALMRSRTRGAFQLWAAPRSKREARVIDLSPVLTGRTDRVAQPLDLVIADVDVGHAEERGDRLLGRSGEVGLHDVCEHILARRLGRRRRVVHVARAVFLEMDHLLLAEDPQYGSHGRVG